MPDPIPVILGDRDPVARQQVAALDGRVTAVEDAGGAAHDHPHDHQADGVTFTDTGLAVVAGVTDVHAAIAKADAAFVADRTRLDALEAQGVGASAPLALTRDNGTDTVISGQRTADVTPRWVVDADGKIVLADGANFVLSHGARGLAIDPAGATGDDNVMSRYGGGSGATLRVITLSSSALPLAVRGAASQSGHLTEWQNSAGTVLASIASDGRVLAGDGAAGSPGFAFVNDTNTGLFRVGGDRLQVRVGGTTVLDVDNSGPRIGFLGSDRSGRQAHPGTASGTDAAVINAIRDALITFGLLAAA